MAPSLFSRQTYVMRPRKRDRHLPACVYLRHGAYWLVKRGKWTRLGSDLTAALAEYARHQAHEQGSMPAIIDQALPAILKGKAPATVAQYTIAARKLQDILFEFAPHQVTQRDIVQILAHLEDTPAAANRMLVVLRLVFNWALRSGLVDSNPCVGVPRLKTKARTRRIEVDEFEAIKAEAGDLLGVIMDLCYLTGQRIGDVLMIRRADLRDEGVYVEQQKTKMRVLIAWNPELSAAVERAKSMHKNVASLYLLPGANGEAPKYGTVWTWWKKACAKAGIDDANIHDLRAMSGTEAEQQGLDPQRLLGHKDASMTRRYLRDRCVKVVHGPSIGQSKKKRSTSQ